VDQFSTVMPPRMWLNFKLSQTGSGGRFCSVGESSGAARPERRVGVRVQPLRRNLPRDTEVALLQREMGDLDSARRSRGRMTGLRGRAKAVPYTAEEKKAFLERSERLKELGERYRPPGARRPQVQSGGATKLPSTAAREGKAPQRKVSSVRGRPSDTSASLDAPEEEQRKGYNPSDPKIKALKEQRKQPRNLTPEMREKLQKQGVDPDNLTPEQRNRLVAAGINPPGQEITPEQAERQRKAQLRSERRASAEQRAREVHKKRALTALDETRELRKQTENPMSDGEYEKTKREIEDGDEPTRVQQQKNLERQRTTAQREAIFRKAERGETLTDDEKRVVEEIKQRAEEAERKQAEREQPREVSHVSKGGGTPAAESEHRRERQQETHQSELARYEQRKTKERVDQAVTQAIQTGQLSDEQRKTIQDAGLRTQEEFDRYLEEEYLNHLEPEEREKTIRRTLRQANAAARKEAAFQRKPVVRQTLADVEDRLEQRDYPDEEDSSKRKRKTTRETVTYVRGQRTPEEVREAAKKKRKVRVRR